MHKVNRIKNRSITDKLLNARDNEVLISKENLHLKLV